MAGLPCVVHAVAYRQMECVRPAKETYLVVALTKLKRPNEKIKSCDASSRLYQVGKDFIISGQ